MSIKTVSLETAKALKEAGFKKECDLTWEFGPKGSGIEGWRLVHKVQFNNLANRYGDFAPTTDELLEELPQYIKPMPLNKLFYINITFENQPRDYQVGYYEFPSVETKHLFCGESKLSLPEALAQCWLFLKKEGLLNGNK